MLGLQRAAGNRATRALIQRVKAEDFLKGLQGAAGARWHPDMQQLVDEAIDDHGQLEVGNRGYTNGGFEDYAFAVAMSKRDPNFSSSPVGKLVLYLITGAGTPPGAGSLGKLKVKGRELVERPAFASKTQKTVGIVPGQARRHVTAWHNIRAFLNKMAAEKPAVLDAAIDDALSKKIADQDLVDEANALLSKKSDETFGDLGPAFGKKVMLAAYVMNSKVRNLWPGASRENSEIATFSGNLSKYISAYKFHGDMARLQTDIANYQTTSIQAKGVQTAMLDVFKLQNLTPGGLIELLTAKQALLELDQPQNQPLGGPISDDERRIHEMVVYYLYFDVKPTDEELTFIVRYFMRGDQVPLVVPQAPPPQVQAVKAPVASGAYCAIQ